VPLTAWAIWIATGSGGGTAVGGRSTSTTRKDGRACASRWMKMARAQWMARALRKRRFPLLGAGTAYLNPVHPRDLARAFVLAAEKHDARGLYHVAAEPVEMRVFYREWARRLGAKPPRHLPFWLARFLLGDFAKLASFRYRVSSEKVRRELGFRFEFPTYRELLDDLTAV
jgi:nucleoside-diphosphate-sugar epimerase